MSYKITITKVESKQVTKRGDWAIVEKRPWTEKEIVETSTRYGDRVDFLEKNPLKEIYAYTPDRDVSEETETKVLEQTVETLDLAAVIRAVNGL